VSIRPTDRVEQTSTHALVSIVIPFYNSARFLRETLHSVVKQEYPNWECLLVDDGSTDESVSIIKEYQKDTRFQYTRRSQVPKGVSSSRNEGIHHSNGKYLLFLDADDILSPDCLRNRVDYMEQHPSLDFAVFQVETFGQMRVKMTFPRKNYLEAFVGFDFPWTVSSPFWKTDFLKSLGGFNTDLVRFEDPEIHIRALLKSPEFTVLTDSEPDLFYRQWKRSDNGKSTAYQQELKAYTQFLTTVAGLTKSSSVNVKVLRNGIFLFLTRLYPPIEDWECVHLDNMLDQARKDGILGPIRYRALKARAYLLKTIKSKSFHRILLVVMQLIVYPSQFISMYGDVLKSKIQSKNRVNALS
jgi:glycosyltransferase involved in cell wall biosynthesis